MPRLVLVYGPAGVGMSRLGWEFFKYIDGLAQDVWWHRGRCLSYGDGVAFWALAETFRQRLGIAEEDPAEVAAGKLAGGLDRFVSDPAERAYVGLDDLPQRLWYLVLAGRAAGHWCLPFARGYTFLRGYTVEVAFPHDLRLKCLAGLGMWSARRP